MPERRRRRVIRAASRRGAPARPTGWPWLKTDSAVSSVAASARREGGEAQKLCNPPPSATKSVAEAAPRDSTVSRSTVSAIAWVVVWETRLAVRRLSSAALALARHRPRFAFAQASGLDPHDDAHDQEGAQSEPILGIDGPGACGRGQEEEVPGEEGAIRGETAGPAPLAPAMSTTMSR